MQAPGMLVAALSFGCILVFPGCGDATAAHEPVALGKDTEHFMLRSTSDDATEDEMDDVAVRAEILFERIDLFLGQVRTPADPIRIVLEGDETTRGSYVDFDGMHLYRYRPDDGGYLAVLAHEFAHAFAVEWFIAHSAWDWPTYRFFDEGFAEYVAQEVDPDKIGFPFYGYPEDVIAGQWLTVQGAQIPLSAMRERHAQLNDRCNLQVYVQRASWFRYVDQTYGRDAVLQIVYPDAEPTSELVKGVVGVGLEVIDQLWEGWLRDRYDARDDTSAVRQAYAARTSWYTACSAGTEF